MAHDPPSGDKKAPKDPSIADLRASTAVAAAPVHFPLRGSTVGHEHQTLVKPGVDQRTNDDRESHEQESCHASESGARQDDPEGASHEEEAGLDVLASAMMMSSEFSGSTTGREEREEDSLMGSDDEGEKSYSDEDDRECSSIQSSQALDEDRDTCSDHDEHLSQPGICPFEIGVGLLEMEGAMVDCLKHLSPPGDAVPNTQARPNTVYRCNICGLSNACQDRIVEHVLLQHRMIILSSMQDLDRYSSQYSSTTTQSDVSFPALSESFQAVASSLQNLPPINKEKIPELSESVAKTLEAGPGVWIIRHVSDKHRRKISAEEDARSAGPILDREGARTEEPEFKRQRVDWPPQQAPDLQAAAPPFVLPWVTPMSHPIPAPIALPIMTLSNMRWMGPPYGSVPNMPGLFNAAQPGAFSFNPNGISSMPLFNVSTMEDHAFSAVKGTMPPTQKSLSTSLGEAPSVAATAFTTAFNTSSLTKPLPQYASATRVQATNADIKGNPFVPGKPHERRVLSSVKRNECDSERREGKPPDRKQHEKSMDQNRNNHQLIHV